MKANFIPKNIESWPIDRLIPYARNARLHSEEQIAQVASSIKEFGFTNPILVDSTSGVIAGHARLAAARQLGLKEVPVIVLDHLDHVQKRAYILVDNKLAENATWDPELLRLELETLKFEDFDLSVTGFSDADYEALFSDVDEEPLGDPESVPALERDPVTRAGEIWIMGSHRIICGDALALECYDRLLNGEPAEMVFTDPPYNVDYQSKSRRIANDNLGLAFAGFLLTTCENLLSRCRGAVYICMSSSELGTLQRAFVEAGGHWSTFLIWAKNTFTLGRSDYQRQYEPILYGWKEGARHYWCGDRNQSDVWSIAKPVVNDLHPTMKPVELVERAVANSSRPGDIVLDAFAGSGSTVIACEVLERKARLIELEPKYVDVVVRRWQEFTGKQAVSATDGRTFEQICNERVAGRGKSE